MSLVLVAVWGGICTVQAQRSDPPAAQDEFVPISELPDDEKLPAAPLLIAAYAVIWIAVFAYVWGIWRRIARVESELADLRRRLADGGMRRN
jgi:CcmD family protein